MPLARAVETSCLMSCELCSWLGSTKLAAPARNPLILEDVYWLCCLEWPLQQGCNDGCYMSEPIALLPSLHFW